MSDSLHQVEQMESTQALGPTYPESRREQRLPSLVRKASRHFSMGMEANQDAARFDRSGRGRQNGGVQRRGYNARGKRPGNSTDEEFGMAYEASQGNGHLTNGHSHSQRESKHSKAGSLDDTASIERHTLQLSTQIGQMQEELAHYQQKLTERSELSKIKAELQKYKETAEAGKLYLLGAISHLEEKLRSMEKEGESMKQRMLEHIEKLGQQEARLKSSDLQLAQLDATDKDKSSRLEDLTRKLAQAHASAEQLQGQKLALEQQLTRSEEGNKAKEAEVFNLQRIVAQLQVKSDTRKLEENAHQSGYAQARGELEAALQKRANSVAYLEGRVQQLEQEKGNMEAHYQRECERLCQRITELQLEQRQSVAPPVCDEDGLVRILENLIPVGHDQAVILGHSFHEELQRILWPNNWEQHYGEKYGTVVDFLIAHPQQFVQRIDSQAFYRPDPAIRFGSGPMETPVAEPAAPGKRMMTPEERTVGPPTPSSSLLSRLQLHKPAEAPVEQAQAPAFMQPAAQPANGLPSLPQARRHVVPSRQVVVTPFLPEVMAKLSGGAHTAGAAPGVVKPGSTEIPLPKPRGWTGSHRARADSCNLQAAPAPSSDAAANKAESTPPGMTIQEGQKAPAPNKGFSKSSTQSPDAQKVQEQQLSSQPHTSQGRNNQQAPVKAPSLSAEVGTNSNPPREGARPEKGRPGRKQGRPAQAEKADRSNEQAPRTPPGFNQALPNTEQAAAQAPKGERRQPRRWAEAAQPRSEPPAESAPPRQESNGPAWNEVAARNSTIKPGANKENGNQDSAGGTDPPNWQAGPTNRAPRGGVRKQRRPQKAKEAQEA